MSRSSATKLFALFVVGLSTALAPVVAAACPFGGLGGALAGRLGVQLGRRPQVARKTAPRPRPAPQAVRQAEPKAIAKTAATKPQQAPERVAAPTRPVQPSVDLELVDVRLLPADDANGAAGAAVYRVRIRNRGTADVTRPFDVLGVRTTGDEPVANSTPTIVRVERIAAAQALEVDLRLDAASAASQEQGAARLLLAVDSEQEVVETDEYNNVARPMLASIPLFNTSSLAGLPTQSR